MEPPVAPSLPTIAVDVPAALASMMPATGGGAVRPVVPPARPPRPAGPEQPGKLTKQQKKERARQRLAERGLLEDAPRVSASSATVDRTEAARAAARAAGVVGVPRAARALAKLDVLMGLAHFFVGLAIMAGVAGAAETTVAGSPTATPLLLVLGIAFLVAAVGIGQGLPYGRKVQAALCVAAFVVGGLSILPAVLVAIYLLLPSTALVYSGRSPRQMTGAERATMETEQGGPILVRVAAFIQTIILVFRLWPLVAARF
jgi:hypothetical protein